MWLCNLTSKKKNFKAQAFYLSIRNLLLALISALILPNPLMYQPLIWVEKMSQIRCTFHRMVVKSILNSTYGMQSVKGKLGNPCLGLFWIFAFKVELYSYLTSQPNSPNFYSCMFFWQSMEYSLVYCPTYDMVPFGTLFNPNKWTNSLASSSLPN
jgi:hypothetical protein